MARWVDLSYARVDRVPIDKSYYRLIFHRDKSRRYKRNFRKEPFKVVKFQNLVENAVICGKYSLTKFSDFLIIMLRVEIATTFGSNVVAISARNTMRKFVNFVRLYIIHITTFFNQIVGFFYFYTVLSRNLVFLLFRPKVRL